MALIPHTRSYENWAPVVARVLLALQIGTGAWFKITAFGMQAAAAGSVGIPFPQIAVALALILEVACVVALIIGWQLRAIAMVMAAYIALLAVLFYHTWGDPMTFGLFMSHLGLIAAFLYVSVYGAKHLSVQKD